MHTTAKDGGVPNKERERQIIASTACPECAAIAGQLCRVNPKSRQSGPPRPIVHSERRRAWQKKRAIDARRQQIHKYIDQAGDRRDWDALEQLEKELGKL